MRLKIEHTRIEDGAAVTYRAKYWLTNGGEQVYVSPWLSSQTLRSLATRWFCIHGDSSHGDQNRSLVSISAADDATTLGDLRKGYEVTSEDPVFIAACDELVMRACAMIHETWLYHIYLSKADESNYSLRELRPSGKSLPEVSEEVKEAATSA